MNNNNNNNNKSHHFTGQQIFVNSDSAKLQYKSIPTNLQLTMYLHKFYCRRPKNFKPYSRENTQHYKANISDQKKAFC